MTLYTQILNYLGEEWIFGGTLERAFPEHKASNISRRLRELYQEGKIERRLVEVWGVKNKVVQYRKLLLESSVAQEMTPVERVGQIQGSFPVKALRWPNH